jgi:hypothetical protein
MQSYLNWKVTGVAITCLDKHHNIPVHILDEGNVLSWDFMLFQGNQSKAQGSPKISIHLKHKLTTSLAQNKR